MSEEKELEFEGTIESQTLKECMLALTGAVDEGVLRFKEEGVTSKAVDPANVAMVSLDMKKGMFSDYTLKGEELVVGMDFGKLLNFLKIGNGDVWLKLNTEKLQVKLGNLSYNMSLFALDALRREPKVPELECPASVTIELEEFKRGVNTAERISDYVEIGMNSKEFFMDAEGEDKFKLVIPKEDCVEFDVDTVIGTEQISSKYSLEYLKAMAKGVGMHLVTLKINKDFPLQMQFQVTDDCEVMYLLAPRIEGD